MLQINRESGVPRRTRRAKVKSACDRCRRHKLRCDKERPCSLCLRSEVPCTTSARETDRPSSRRHDGRALQRHHPRASGYPVEDARSEGALEPEIHIEQEPGAPNTIHHLQKTNLGTSNVDWTAEILKEFDSSKSTVQGAAYALPGGKRLDDVGSCEGRLVSELMGVSLPPAPLMRFLIDTYFRSIHWFMVMLHEPTVRAQFHQVEATGVAPGSRRAPAAILILVLIIGANYAHKADVNALFPLVDLAALQQTLLAAVQAHFIELMDEGELEGVQICLLLSSFYLYNGRPGLGFIVLGTGVRCGQAIGLHKESMWRPLSIAEKENHRRVWWALYTFDRFASVVFGRPCIINDQDSHVKLPHNMADICEPHPSMATMEKCSDGSLHRVNIFSYQRYKFRLYQIISPILTEIYSRDISDIPKTVETVRLIHERLEDWASSLPAELKLGELEKFGEESVVVTTFRLQALVLQLAYHNTRILLHRPLLSCNLEKLPKATAHAVRKAVALSKNQCWESAIRTSELARYDSCFRAVRGSYGAAYMGMHLFTAGMMLSVVALAAPLSDKVAEAKHALARIIHMTRNLESDTILAAQSSKILERLVRLILSKEMEAILDTNTAPTIQPDATQPSTGNLNFGEHESQQLETERAQACQQVEASPSYISADGQDINDQASLGELWNGIDLYDGIFTMQQAVWSTVVDEAAQEASQNAQGQILTQESTMVSATSGNSMETDHGQMWLWGVNNMFQ